MAKEKNTNVVMQLLTRISVYNM